MVLPSVDVAIKKSLNCTVAIKNLLFQVRGTTKYHLSPHEQKAFAGVISTGVPNTLWRIRWAQDQNWGISCEIGGSREPKMIRDRV